MAQSRASHRSWTRLLVILVAVVLLAPVIMMVIMMPMMGWWIVGGPGTGMSMVSGIGTILLCLIVLLGIGYLIYRLFTRVWPSVDDPALEELRLAYARGELSQEEFEQRQDDLRQSE